MATRFGIDLRVAILLHRSGILQALGYPAAANADAEDALSSARATGHASTLLFTLVSLRKILPLFGELQSDKRDTKRT